MKNRMVRQMIILILVNLYHFVFYKVPFLLLSSTFDPEENWCWAALNENVESWLMSMEHDRKNPLWVWGLEIFWITFVASYLNFPQGVSPQISPVIPLHGSFISSWVANESQDVSDVASILEDLWLEFRLVVFSLIGTCFDTVIK